MITTSSGVRPLKSNAPSDRVREDLDPHLAQPVVDVRIVDDLADEKNPPIGEFPARLVGVLDRALDAVAEAEFAGEPDRDVPDHERVVVRAQLVDDPPVVVRRELVLDLRLEPEALPEVRGWLRRGGGRHGCKSSDGFIR